jgi:hypothetical protein
MLLILGDSRKIIFCERVHIPAILDVLDSCFSTVIGACHMLKKFKVSSKISYVAIILSSLAIAGCASRADSIAPTAIPSANYRGLECEETKVALEQKRSKKYALTNQQNNAATGDAVGVFFILLPLGSIFGADKEGELAQAKGEVLALEGAVTINCA